MSKFKNGISFIKSFFFLLRFSWSFLGLTIVRVLAHKESTKAMHISYFIDILLFLCEELKKELKLNEQLIILSILFA